MKALIAKLLALIAASLLGVSYTEAMDKPFDTASYYQIEKGDVDYKSIYDSIRTPASNYLGKESNFSVKTASKGTPIANASSMVWPIALPEAEAVDFESLLATVDTTTVDGYNLIPAEEDSEILSPAIMKFIRAGRDNEYTGRGLGLYIVLGCTSPDESTYEVTIGNLKRLWCDMDKVEPDAFLEGDTTKPQYFPSETIPTATTFSAGNVIGELGKTGRDGELIIKIEQKSLKNGKTETKTIDLETFYADMCKS